MNTIRLFPVAPAFIGSPSTESVDPFLAAMGKDLAVHYCRIRIKECQEAILIATGQKPAQGSGIVLAGNERADPSAGRGLQMGTRKLRK